MCAQWARRSDCPDNQEVGLEAAILERVRNSSLVEWSGAANPTGLKHITEATECPPSQETGGAGRGASSAAEKVDRKDGWSANECECRYE